MTAATGAGARWAPVAAGFAVLFVTTGVHLAFGILFKPILAELGSDRTALSLAPTASLLVNAAGQPLLGALIDRVGPRRVILPSVALMTVGTALVGLAEAPWQVVLLYGGVAAVGYTGAGILPVAVHVTRWFPGQPAFATAVAACGFSFGHLTFTQLAAFLAVAAGWRRTYTILGGVLAVALLALARWLRDAPGPPPGRGRATPRAVGLDRPALRTAGFWGMTAGLMGCGFTDFLMTTHLPAFATDLGLSPAVAANAVSLWAAANVAGILLAGGLAGRIGARAALVGTYLVRAVAFAWLLGVREAWQLYLFALLFGSTFFTTAPLSATLTAGLFGTARQGRIFGTANLFHHTAGALGALAGGLAFDLARSYRPVFLAGGLLVVASAVATAFARPPRP